jgi:hypothetical protein
MVAGPIALTLSETIDKQLSNAMSADGCNRYNHHGSLHGSVENGTN